MTYGVMSQETHIALVGQGLGGVTSFVDDMEPQARIDIVVYGALDESFEINDHFHYELIVNCIADSFRDRFEGDWIVDAYHPNPDLCEKLYERSGNG